MKAQGIRRAVTAGLLTIASAGASAQSVDLVIKHPLVYAHLNATSAAEQACLPLSFAYWDAVALAQYGRGDPESALGAMTQCVLKHRDDPKPSLLAALRSLESKPGASKALKDYYLRAIDGRGV